MPLIVSPVTLRPRFNAVQKFAAPALAPGQLPAEVDARQASLFGAAWTLGSVKALAQGGASSLTFYEATGWRGVLERGAGSPLPDKFPSRPGEVFPLFHALADACELQNAPLLRCQSSDEGRVRGWAARVGEVTHLMLANITPRPQRLTLRLHAPSARVRRLDVGSVWRAMAEPLSFRSSTWGELGGPTGELGLELGAYETVKIEAAW